MFRYSIALRPLGLYILALCALPQVLWAQTPRLPGNAAKAFDPNLLAKQAVENEIKDLSHEGMYLRYRVHKVDTKGDVIRDLIETKDGTVARLIARNNRPLTPEENRAELDRLASMMSHPEEYARHQRRDQAEKDHAKGVLEMIPKGLFFEVVSPQEVVPGHSAPDPRLVELTFKPNPNFQPPTIESQVLTSMAGRVWIDSQEQQIVRLEVHLVSDAAFGWGLLAKIYKGDSVIMDQTDAGEHHWIMTHLSQKITLRALMVKTVRLDTEEDISHFEVLHRGMSYQEGIKVLEDTPLGP